MSEVREYFVNPTAVSMGLKYEAHVAVRSDGAAYQDRTQPSDIIAQCSSAGGRRGMSAKWPYQGRILTCDEGIS